MSGDWGLRLLIDEAKRFVPQGPAQLPETYRRGYSAVPYSGKVRDRTDPKDKRERAVARRRWDEFRHMTEGAE